MTGIIATDIQLLEQDAIVVMFELDLRKLGGGEGVLRFSPTSVDGGSVWFNGYEYLPIPVKGEGFTVSGSGAMPRPTLTMAAPTLSFLSLVVNADDLVGCPITRLRTYRKYLDDGATPNPEATFPPDYYLIERKSSQKRTLLQFELSAKMDQQGKMIPGRTVMRDSCSHKFRYWANGQWNYDGVTCPYSAPAMFEKNGVPTSDPTKSRCGKRLSDCKLHFGATSVLPFYGYPGVGRYA
jgi:lambda family phage minor tail protein L